MKLTIEEIINTVTQSGSRYIHGTQCIAFYISPYSYPSQLQVTMADIFDLIIRSGTYDGQFKYALILKSFAQSLVSSRSCDEQKYVMIEDCLPCLVYM